MEMAKLGFYDIRTFECLAREVQSHKFFYNTIYQNPDKEDDEEGGAEGAGQNMQKFKKKKGENTKKKP